MGEGRTARGTKRPGKRLPFALTREEVSAMYRVPSHRTQTGPRAKAILAALAGAGLRVSELTSLCPSDIRWDSSTIEVKRGKGAKDRNISVNAETLALLQGWASKRPAGSRRFFCTLKGGKLMNRYVQQLVKRTAERAGVANHKRVSPHTLRHTYATIALEDGLNLIEVQKLLGHASVATTQVYTHVRDSELAAKVAARPAFVCNISRLPAPSDKFIGGEGEVEVELSDAAQVELLRQEVLTLRRELSAMKEEQQARYDGLMGLIHRRIHAGGHQE